MSTMLLLLTCYLQKRSLNCQLKWADWREQAALTVTPCKWFAVSASLDHKRNAWKITSGNLPQGDASHTKSETCLLIWPLWSTLNNPLLSMISCGRWIGWQNLPWTLKQRSLKAWFHFILFVKCHHTISIPETEGIYCTLLTEPSKELRIELVHFFKRTFTLFLFHLILIMALI